MSNSLKSLAYAAALCIVCSLLLTAASSGLRPFQERNVLIDRHRNILKAAGVLQEGQELSSDRIEQLYAARIRPLMVDAVGRILPGKQTDESVLPIYLVVDGQTIESFIIPIDTKGLWCPIHAYLALNTDGSTVKGFTVYQHSETSGLGGRSKSAGSGKTGWERKLSLATDGL
jgi:Na+-transporting NADH:ubiquinone oxidoreductase subunit C